MSRKTERLTRIRTHSEEAALLGMIPILESLKVLVQQASPRWVCGTCGCLLFDSDRSCPKCRMEMAELLQRVG